MFSKELQRLLEQYFSAIGDNTHRTINMAKGLIILIQIILSSLAIVKNLWDNGFGSKIESLEAATNVENVSGFTKRWWKAAQATFLIYSITMKLPYALFYQLSYTDGEGNVIYPYRYFDPIELETLALKNIEQFAWSEPEQNVIVEPEVIEAPQI